MEKTLQLRRDSPFILEFGGGSPVVWPKSQDRLYRLGRIQKRGAGDGRASSKEILFDPFLRIPERGE
jgi:hypothetical protein